MSFLDPPQVVCPSRFAVHRRTVTEADGVVREGQAHQQRAGPTRTRESGLQLCIVFN